MDPDFPFIIAAIAILSGTLISVVKIWANRSKTPASSDRRLHGIEERLSRIEQAVDAIAIETERISEGQRFTTKLLADRSERVERVERVQS